MVKMNKRKKVLETFTVVIMVMVLYLTSGTRISASNIDYDSTNLHSTLYAGVTERLHEYDELLTDSIDSVVVENKDTVIVSEANIEEDVDIENDIELESDYLIYKDNKIFESESLSADLQHLAMETAAKYDVPGEIVIALCWRESAYNPKLVSSTNDYGLCQINKMNFKYLNKQLGRTLDYFDPADSLEACCYFLNSLTKKYGTDDWHYILMCYNMGEGGARKQVKRGNYSTKYSRFIMDKARELGFSD